MRFNDKDLDIFKSVGQKKVCILGVSLKHNPYYADPQISKNIINFVKTEFETVFVLFHDLGGYYMTALEAQQFPDDKIFSTEKELEDFCLQPEFIGPTEQAIQAFRENTGLLDNTDGKIHIVRMTELLDHSNSQYSESLEFVCEYPTYRNNRSFGDALKRMAKNFVNDHHVVRGEASIPYENLKYAFDLSMLYLGKEAHGIFVLAHEISKRFGLDGKKVPLVYTSTLPTFMNVAMRSDNVLCSLTLVQIRALSFLDVPHRPAAGGKAHSFPNSFDSKGLLTTTTPMSPKRHHSYDGFSHHNGNGYVVKYGEGPSTETHIETTEMLEYNHHENMSALPNNDDSDQEQLTGEPEMLTNARTDILASLLIAAAKLQATENPQELKKLANAAVILNNEMSNASRRHNSFDGIGGSGRKQATTVATQSSIYAGPATSRTSSSNSAQQTMDQVLLPHPNP